MSRWIAVAVVAGLTAAVAAFVVPTVWYRPWSIEHFWGRVFLEQALARPMLLSQLRLLEPWGIDSHASELDDFSWAAELRRADAAANDLELLRGYARESLEPEQRVSADVLEWWFAIQADGRPFVLHRWQVNPLDGAHLWLAEFMLEVHRVRSAHEAETYVARLAHFAGALEQLRLGVVQRVARGLLAPRFMIRRVRRQIAGLIEPAPLEHPLYRGFAEQVGRLDLDTGERARLLDAARKEIEGSVVPGYRALGDELARVEEVSTGDAGAWTLPAGDAYYAWALRLHTTTDRSAAEIHAVATAEVARLQSELRALLDAAGQSSGDVAQGLRALDASRRAAYEDGDAGRARILADYRTILDETPARLGEQFARLPRQRLEVERMPETGELHATRGYYRAAALDGSRPAILYVNLRDARATAREAVRARIHREALPGRHLQFATAFESGELPIFRRLIPLAAFVEGWALYAGALAAEQGWLSTPGERIEVLRAELLEAARAAVDTGVHARRWTRRQAIDWIAQNTGLAEGDAEDVVERIVADPGLACAPTIGLLEIRRLRERARTGLGERFRAADFHDAILRNGPLPLLMLERAIDALLQPGPLRTAAP